MTHYPAEHIKDANPTTLKNEMWKVIPGVPNYEASSLGRIRSVFVRVLKPKLNYRTLKDTPEYELVVIKNKRTMVHRLVAAAFLGVRPEGLIVHHKDHNKSNNRPENLEYVTPSHNTKMAYADGRLGRTLKLTAFARKKMVELYETGKCSTGELVKQFRINRSTIATYLRRAGIKPHGLKKLTPLIYAEIRGKYVPYKYPASRLAKEYKVSESMVEAILGMRAVRRGKRFPAVGKEVTR